MSIWLQAAGRKCGIISAVTLRHSSSLGDRTSGMCMSFSENPRTSQLTDSPVLPCFAFVASQSEMCAPLMNAASDERRQPHQTAFPKGLENAQLGSIAEGMAIDVERLKLLEGLEIPDVSRLALRGQAE